MTSLMTLITTQSLNGWQSRRPSLMDMTSLTDIQTIKDIITVGRRPSLVDMTSLTCSPRWYRYKKAVCRRPSLVDMTSLTNIKRHTYGY